MKAPANRAMQTGERLSRAAVVAIAKAVDQEIRSALHSRPRLHRDVVIGATLKRPDIAALGGGAMLAAYVRASYDQIVAAELKEAGAHG